MGFKVGSLTVIDDNGDIDWNRIKDPNVVTSTAPSYTYTHGSGDTVKKTETYIERVGDAVRLRTDRYLQNCNCNCNCNCQCRD